MEKHSQIQIQVYMKSTFHHISLTQNCVLGQMAPVICNVLELLYFYVFSLIQSSSMPVYSNIIR